MKYLDLPFVRMRDTPQLGPDILTFHIAGKHQIKISFPLLEGNFSRD